MSTEHIFHLLTASRANSTCFTTKRVHFVVEPSKVEMAHVFCVLLSNGFTLIRVIIFALLWKKRTQNIKYITLNSVIKIFCQQYFVNNILSTLFCQQYFVNNILSKAIFCQRQYFVKGNILSTIFCQQYFVNNILSTIFCQQYFANNIFSTIFCQQYFITLFYPESQPNYKKYICYVEKSLDVIFNKRTRDRWSENQHVCWNIVVCFRAATENFFNESKLIFRNFYFIETRETKEGEHC